MPVLRPLGLSLLLALLVLPAAPAAGQTGSGSRFRVTTKMEMPGMPFQMPAQTHEVCGPKNSAGQTMVPRQDNCEVRNYRVSGNKSSFDMVCTGQGAMSGHGEFELLGPEAYRGRIDVMAEGQKMVMSFDGKRIGDCNYATESPAAKANQMIGQSCDQMLSGQAEGLLGAGAQFLGKDAMCASRKTAYCAKLAPLADNLDLLRQRSQAEAQMRAQGGSLPGSFWDDFQGCGQSRAMVLGKACGKAERSGDFGFVAEMCPEQIARLCPVADPRTQADFLFTHCAARAQALTAQHCAGRDFTAMMGSPYAAFCSRAAGQGLQQRQPQSEAPHPPAKKPSWKDKLKDVIGG